MAARIQWQQTWNGTLLDWEETWSEGSSAELSIASAATLTVKASELTLTAFSVAPAATLQFGSGSAAAGAFNVPGAASGLWEGTQLAQPAAFGITATATLTALSGTGSAFYINEDQTALLAPGASIAHAAFVSVASAFPIWAGSNAQDFAAFSIAATATLTPAAAPFVGGEFAPAGVAAVNLAGAPFVGGEFTMASATAATPWAVTILNPRGVPFGAAATLTFGPYSQASGAVSVAAASNVEFGQSAGAVSQGAVDSASTSAVAFTGDSIGAGAVNASANSTIEFGQPGGGVEFGALQLQIQLSLDLGGASIAGGALRVAGDADFTAINGDIVEVDDDQTPDEIKRLIFQGAADAQREFADRKRLARIKAADDADILVFAATLTQAVSEWTRAR